MKRQITAEDIFLDLATHMVNGIFPREQFYEKFTKALKVSDDRFEGLFERLLVKHRLI